METNTAAQTQPVAEASVAEAPAIVLSPDERAEMHLCEVFRVQVPPKLDPIVKRRLFTLAARCNIDLVDDSVTASLAQLGAYSPTVHGKLVACFGQLWKNGHKACSICGVQSACEGQTKAVGLDRITPSLRLLGHSASHRTPTVLPKQDLSPDQVKLHLAVYTRNDRDEELLRFLNETLTPAFLKDEIYYSVQISQSRSLYAFCVGKPEDTMTLRFLLAGERVKPRLRMVGQGDAAQHVMPEELSVEDALQLMNDHLTEIIATK